MRKSVNKADSPEGHRQRLRERFQKTGRHALADPLVSHEERIHKAMGRIFAMREWTAIQRQWLGRIEKQLIAQTVMDREDFDRGAFAEHGGFNRLNRIFQGNFQQVLDDIRENLYLDERKTA
jgi:type I restriction enzyme, R subunit